MTRLDTTIARRVAENYESAVNDNDFAAVTALFAPDGFVQHPARGRHEGTEEILAFYQTQFERQPRLRLLNIGVAADVCYAEFEGSRAGSDEVGLVVDIFGIGEGGELRSNVICLGPRLPFQRA
ncbi:MAG TPA: nuclear transport factor 2 family protein [Ilumatobacter sp.]|nr:nuclear transport factor 2 family protein [Ilumatobacter sp.]